MGDVIRYGIEAEFINGEPLITHRSAVELGDEAELADHVRAHHDLPLVLKGRVVHRWHLIRYADVNFTERTHHPEAL